LSARHHEYRHPARSDGSLTGPHGLGRGVDLRFLDWNRDCCGGRYPIVRLLRRRFRSGSMFLVEPAELIEVDGGKLSEQALSAPLADALPPPEDMALTRQHGFIDYFLLLRVCVSNIGHQIPFEFLPKIFLDEFSL
jgi:hypothetical protein